MFCSSCGKAVGEKNQFCGSCGHEVSHPVRQHNAQGEQAEAHPEAKIGGPEKGAGSRWFVPVIIVLFVLLFGAALVGNEYTPSTSQNIQQNTVTDADLEMARSRARDTKRIADVSQLRAAAEQYFEDHNGTYPTALNQNTIGQYMTKIPVDPLTGEQYGYIYGPTAKPTIYGVLAELEQTASALKNDADYSWNLADGTVVDGARETCTSAPLDCLFDQGYQE